MVNKTYHTNRHSTRTEPDIPTSEKFKQRGREKRAKGEDATHWFKAADIIKRIEAGKPVGHYRRRRNRRAA